MVSLLQALLRFPIGAGQLELGGAGVVEHCLPPLLVPPHLQTCLVGCLWTIWPLLSFFFSFGSPSQGRILRRNPRSRRSQQ